jgi:hypothetical protein
LDKSFLANLKKAAVFLAAIFALVFFSVRLAGVPGWSSRFKTLEPGIEFAEFELPSGAGDGDRLVRVVRVDPAFFTLKLYSALEPGEGGISRTVRDWAARKNLCVAINASMYQEDGVTSVSLLRKRGYVNNPRLTLNQSVLLFDPVEEGLPPVEIVDLEEEGFAKLEKYEGAVQSIRMLSGRRENTWTQQDKKWPAALIGLDRKGRVLFIHTKSSHSMHDLVESLLDLPLGLGKLQYAEGGNEAQLLVDAGNLRGFYAPAGVGWAVPNVIGFERKK